MRRFLGVCSLAVCGLAGTASAQDTFLQGVYLPSQELCQKAKTGSLESIMQDGNIVLTAKGMKGTDYDCRFLQVLKSPDSNAWVATTLCKEPSGNYPDLFSISESKPGSVDVVSVYGDDDDAADEGDADGDGSSDNGAAGQDDSGGASSADKSGGDDSADNQSDTGTYYHCEGVAAP